MNTGCKTPHRVALGSASAVCAVVITTFGGCSTMQDGPTTSPTQLEGQSTDLPTEAAAGIELCDPPAGDVIADRSEFAQVACDAPDGTNFSVVYVTPPGTQTPSVLIGTAADRETAPWAQVVTRGLWSAGTYRGAEVDGDNAVFRYTLHWSPNPKRDGQAVKTRYEDEVTVGDTVTHGPLTYEILGITDTGDPKTSHLDLAVRFDPSIPLTKDTP